MALKSRQVLAPTNHNQQQNQPQPSTSSSPPSKASLKAWWKQWTTVQKFAAKKEGDDSEKRELWVFGFRRLTAYIADSLRRY